MMTKLSSEREQGFTLIELLMAIAISGIIITAIATGFIVSMRGTASAHERLVASNGAHTLSTYFTADVESANPDLTTTASAATLGCASEPTGTTTNVLRLQWSEMTTATELRAFSVSYRILALDTDGDTVDDEWQLVRYSCSAKSPDILSDAAFTDHIVVDHLHEPIDPFTTKATIDPLTPQDISMVVFAALAKDESTPYSYTFSGTMRTPAPVPHVSSITSIGSPPPNALQVSWTVTFSEAVTGVDLTGPFADFAFAYTGNLAGASVASVTGSGTTYTVTANTGTGQGTLALKVDDNDTIVSTDGDRLGGTGIDNGDYTGAAYTVDRLAPAVVVDRNSTQAPTASTVPIPNAFTATFNEKVSDFDDPADVINLGTATGAVFSIGPDPAGTTGKDYLISVTTLTGNGTIIPRVIAGAATDSAGNGNTVSSNGADNQVTYNTVAASVSIINVELRNSGAGSSQVGRLEKDDQVVITFSDSMDVETFCSTWTGTTPSLTANGLVRVTVTDGGLGHDVLTVTTTSGCAFHLGSVDLGSAGWVTATGPTNFEGNGANASEIAYNDATRQLTITIGDGTSGPSGVPASTPIYDADTINIRGANTGMITNSPKTATGSSRF